MLNETIHVLKKFRDTIYNFFSSRRDATMELIDSLSSNTRATSVIELSLNSLHRRNYASITKVLNQFRSSDAIESNQQDLKLMQLHTKLCLAEQKRHFNLFALDCTPAPRIFSPTLQDRSYVYAPNPVCNNKPVTVWHKHSVVVFLPEKLETGSPPWVIPLSCKRVSTEQDGKLVGMSQIADCIKSQSEFSTKLGVSVGDNEYNSPLCLGEAKKNPDQVHVSRARNNRNFFYQYTHHELDIKKSGRPKKYGSIYKLNDVNTWETPDEKLVFSIISAQGKKHTIKIECWNDLVMRGKKGCDLSDYPFRLLRICLYTESGELLFKRPLWITVAGQRRMELSLTDIFNSYRQRFDIEHFFRFGKNRLLMDKIQTPDVLHEEAFW